MDIKTELCRRGLLIIQDAISQNAVNTVVQQTKLLLSILSAELSELGESETEMLESLKNKLEKTYNEFLNPNIEIDGIKPAEIQAAAIQIKRQQLANEIYNIVNEIIKFLTKNVRGVFG